MNERFALHLTVVLFGVSFVADIKALNMSSYHLFPHSCQIP